MVHSVGSFQRSLTNKTHFCTTFIRLIASIDQNRKIMKRIAFTFLSLMLLTAVSFSALAQGQKREVSGFTSVASAGPFSVHIKLDGTESLRLEADANIINDIETVVEHGTLKIKFKNRDNQYHNPGKIDVYVTAKSLNGLINSGSGTMKVDGTIS